MVQQIYLGKWCCLERFKTFEAFSRFSGIVLNKLPTNDILV